MIDWNYILGQIATVAFDILYFGAIIGTIVIIILDNRNPVKTMAWILILLFLPIVGLVFYFSLGAASVANGLSGGRVMTVFSRSRWRNTWRKIARKCNTNIPVLSDYSSIPTKPFRSKETG